MSVKKIIVYPENLYDMKSFSLTAAFLFLFFIPCLSFAQNDKQKNETPTNSEERKKRVIIIEQDELNRIREDIRIDMKQLKRELKMALREIEEVDWREIEEEIEMAMEEAKEGLEEANEALRELRIEIDDDDCCEDIDIEIDEEVMIEIEERLGDAIGAINQGSPRIRVITQTPHSSNRNRKIERNFSQIKTEPNTELSDKMKKTSTTLFGDDIQNSFTVTTTEKSAKDGTFLLTFSLPKKETTYVEVYDSEGNNIYYESLVDFTGAYKGKIDLAVNGTDTYTLILRQGKNYLSRKITLE